MRFRREGEVLAFRRLPFFWNYGPVLCQHVFEALVASAPVMGVVVLVYLDDVLLVGRVLWVIWWAEVVVTMLRKTGGIISPKS